MFERIKCRVLSWVSCLRCPPPACILVPALLLISSFIIRLFCGSGCVVCRFTGGAGLFPGMFLYTVGYVLRLILCGIILASALFSCRVERRAWATLFAAALCCMMLFEYKLIFAICSFFVAALMCLLCGGAAFASLMFQRGCSKCVSICTLLFLIMQSVFFVQIVSLIFCF